MTSQHIRQLQLESDIIIQGHRIELGELKLSVFTVMGSHDDLQVKNWRFSSVELILRCQNSDMNLSSSSSLTSSGLL